MFSGGKYPSLLSEGLTLFSDLSGITGPAASICDPDSSSLSPGDSGGRALPKMTVPAGKFGRIFVPGLLNKYL